MSGCTSDLATTRMNAAARVAAPVRGLWVSWLQRSWRAYSSRKHLAEMDARMLQDIGIAPADAAAEAERAPWDHAPRRRG